MLRADSAFCRVGACILALLMMSALIPAQTASHDWRSVQNLAPDSSLAVKTKSGGKYHGVMVIATSDRLIINSDEPAFPGRTARRREFTREQIREVRLTAAGTSMAVGAAIGGASGAAIGIAADATAKSHEYRGVVAVVLGALGAGIGAAIAHHHPFVKGKRIYVAP